ncbi:glycerophosphodiester phosphodiesterase [Actinomyces bowdenii]|uniref:Glycerophosphodiester phosphodiesterase n=1 Tax=Actinomyces bowdenii TaxID=131109 RepID=A0A3P1V873_9ACTO|nr:glycerophosphodiester phosphodiesterase [Actinomyces bowdenii]MBO3725737.1 glycerophosphodiester phosphodiesterase [Actinomyces bowdenii]RRD30349.1 glycerophosphodiester phosphodiesterase [Actinomyces bowdenii]
MARTRRPAVIAHRGGGREVPENTWSAVEHVSKLGLGWMETDLRATADGVVVLAHDEDLRRASGDPRRVDEVMWAELADLDAGDGRGFVRLSDALELHPRLRFNVDLKASGVVQGALQTVRDAEALGRVRFASFSARRLAVLRRQEPRATTSLGVGDVMGLMLLSEAALPLPHTRWGWTRGRVDAVQVPESYRGVPIVTRRFVAAAHREGLEVHVWTVDSPERMRRLAALNVDAIMTDVPTLATKVLATA